MGKMKLKATKSHTSNYPNPITFEKGDVLILGRRDDGFEGWIWVTTADGNAGWAPEQLVDEEQVPAVATAVYTANELDTRKGEELELITCLNEWAWVKNAKDECGWVPLNTTNYADHDHG